MATRLPASQHTREELTALIEGRLSTASAARPSPRSHAAPVACSPLSFSLERIENMHTEIADVDGVACYESHPMHLGGCREKSIDHR